MLLLDTQVEAAELQLGMVGAAEGRYLRHQDNTDTILPYFNLQYGYLNAGAEGLMVNMPVSQTQTINIGLSLRDAAVMSTDFAQLNSRDTAVESRLGWSELSPLGTFSATLAADISEVYQGYEFRLNYDGEYTFESVGDSWTYALGLSYQSSALVNYGYGVSAREADNELSRYRCDNGAWVLALNIGYLHPFTYHYLSYIGSSVNLFSAGIADSPLVVRPWQTNLYIGLLYQF